MAIQNCCVCGIPSLYCKAHERITIAETVKALRIGIATYYRYVEAGKLHPVKLGQSCNSKVLIPRAEVEEMLT